MFPRPQKKKIMQAQKYKRSKKKAQNKETNAFFLNFRTENR